MKKNPGFTMIELLIVVLVMGIIAYISIPSYLSGQSKQKLTNSSKEILRVMNEGRNRALSGLAIEAEDTNSDSSIEVGETILPKAFGVYLRADADFEDQVNNDSQAVLFVDEDNDWAFDPNIDIVIEEVEFPYIAKLYHLEVMEEVVGGDIRHDAQEAIVFYRVPKADFLIRYNDGNWSEVETMPDLSWLRVDLGMWQMADEEGEINDSAYIRSVVAHSVSDYAYICSSIEAYNDDSTACNRNEE